MSSIFATTITQVITQPVCKILHPQHTLATDVRLPPEKLACLRKDRLQRRLHDELSLDSLMVFPPRFSMSAC